MAKETLAITDFTGRLTRVLNGDINSGFAKFATSWGYDPFSKPGNLTWNYQTSSITTVSSMGSVVDQQLILGGIKTSSPFFYIIDNTGRYMVMKNSSTSFTVSNGPYDVSPLDDAVVSIIGSFSSIAASTFNYGASIQPYSGEVIVSSDTAIIWVNQSSVSVDSVASVSGSTSSVVANVPHPLKEFQGKMYYGNDNNIGEVTDIGTFGTITTGSKLSPALPDGVTVTDLDVTPEGDYLLITASFAAPPWLGTPSTTITSGNVRNYAAQSFVFYWNGSDTGVTAVRALPSFPAPSLSTFLDKQYTVTQDTFGMALMEGNSKLLTLPNNLNPTPNALNPNGTFLTWTSPEGLGPVTNDANTYSSVVTSLYYYGSLDSSMPVGLWRMCRIYATDGLAMLYTPLNAVVNNFSALSTVVQGFGKHLISTQERTSQMNTGTLNRFHRFVLNPAAATTPVQGVYETQTQVFSKRISTSQVRVYCEPTATGNAFRLDVIGANGEPVENGTYTYTFGDIVDPQDGSTSVERINFTGDMKTQYSLGIRITNTGTTQMTIKKIEVDYSEEGK